MKINKKDKIFLAGHNGMVGSSIFKKLRENGYKDVITISKKNLDLLDQGRTLKFINRQKPKVVIIAAARVGGIIANSITKPKFLYENLQIQNNLIHGSYLVRCKKSFSFRLKLYLSKIMQTTNEGRFFTNKCSGRK